MIISASRRTDIPAFYSEWLLNRLSEGFAVMPNPRNPNRLGRVELSPDYVDCIVFWTKNAVPILDKLTQIEAMGYPFYFQFTLTPYGKMIERSLPPKAELTQTFSEIGRRIGAARVVWRYDPIMIDATHTVSWHLEKFQHFCEKLYPFTRRCILSFIDPCKSIGSGFRAMQRTEMLAIAFGFSKIAGKYGLDLYTCAEEIELADYRIAHSSCTDKALIEQIIRYSITAKKDANQRPACECIEGVDIGAYDTCISGE